MRMRPSLTSSSPAIRRRSVVLPHPEGPTNTTNDPSAISRSAPWMTACAPNDLRTPSRVMRPMAVVLFYSAEGEPADELALAEPAEHQDGRNGHRRGGRELGPEQSFRARIGVNEDRERRCVGGREVQGPEGLVPGRDQIQQDGR